MQVHWRGKVSEDVALLRRTGSFQLALLSHLRRDDKARFVGRLRLREFDRQR